MKVSDKAIVFGVLVAALAIGFYLMILAPKRQQTSKLNDQIEQLHASISQQEQVASFGEQARKAFPHYYGRLVVLGKAVPQQADTASMLVQLNTISDRSHIDFRSIALGADTAAAGSGTSSSATPATPATPPASPAPTTSTGSSSASAPATSGAAATSTADPAAAPATESSAASLPIGATVGSAGLATLPYTLKMTGDFFDVSNFIGGVDSLVQPRDDGARVSSDGRLFTIDGFALNGGAPGSSPILKASFSVTTYATPADQGLTLGATPSGPAPAGPGATQIQPASSVVAK